MTIHNPIYLQDINALKNNALNYNWLFRWLFFPEGVIENLNRFNPEKPDDAIAHQIYVAFSVDNSFFVWLGKHLLTGLIRFVERDFTQDVIGQDALSLNFFQQKVKEYSKLDKSPCFLTDSESDSNPYSESCSDSNSTKGSSHETPLNKSNCIEVSDSSGARSIDTSNKTTSTNTTTISVSSASLFAPTPKTSIEQPEEERLEDEEKQLDGDHIEWPAPPQKTNTSNCCCW